MNTNYLKISVRPDSDKETPLASSIANKLGLSLGEDADILVWVSESGGVSLSCPNDDPKARLSISFHRGSADHRRKYGGGKSQAIAKAVGIEPGVFPILLDATAGLGGDAFVLASLGSQVTAVERSPILASMLKAARDTAVSWSYSHDPALFEVLNRLTFVEADAHEVLSINSEPAPEVIYLDPMFPDRKKSSAVKKEMKILQRLLEFDSQNESELLQKALDCASHRVVVKRPRHAPPLAGPKSQYSLEGKSTRFDIYPLKKLRPSR